jgi:hypothetical protein
MKTHVDFCELFVKNEAAGQKLGCVVPLLFERHELFINGPLWIAGVLEAQRYLLTMFGEINQEEQSQNLHYLDVK